MFSLIIRPATEIILSNRVVVDETLKCLLLANQRVANIYIRRNIRERLPVPIKLVPPSSVLFLSASLLVYTKEGSLLSRSLVVRAWMGEFKF